jgi:glycine/D-amino acid oxidase-like deaminating enzyme
MTKKADPLLYLDPSYDIIIFGGGVAGLWLLNILTNAGFDVHLIEKESLGGYQTMASQGMIHGGQRYLLGTDSSAHAESVAALPARWDACLGGTGEVDLTGVRVLSETQFMWPAGGRLAKFALSAGTVTLNAKTQKLDGFGVPKAISGVSASDVFELPEKVLDVGSLVKALSEPHSDRIHRAEVEWLTRDGILTVSGSQIKARGVICAAGLGNEEYLNMLDAGKASSQRRPLRQFMVKSMPLALYGHGITTSYRPRVTVTSHPLPSGGFVWYLGGALADETLAFADNDAVAFAKKEMKQIFGHLDWTGKQWAAWHCVRAEPYCSNGRLPDGPVVQEYGSALVVWPTKLTLTPLLGDQVLARLAQRGIFPRHKQVGAMALQLGPIPLAPYPWEQVQWT